VRYVRHSLLPELGIAADVADAASARIDRAFARYPADVRCGLYLGYLVERPAEVVAALRDIARADGPVIVHCAAGKDRTGVLAALILRLCGVDDDDIEDLLLERSERFWAMIARARRGKPIAIETLRKQVAGPRPAPGRTAASRPRRSAR
jgi:hypothetical protein